MTRCLFPLQFSSLKRLAFLVGAVERHLAITTPKDVLEKSEAVVVDIETYVKCRSLVKALVFN